MSRSSMNVATETTPSVHHFLAFVSGWGTTVELSDLPGTLSTGA
jgi:hypothetical protein